MLNFDMVNVYNYKLMRSYYKVDGVNFNCELHIRSIFLPNWNAMVS